MIGEGSFLDFDVGSTGGLVLGLPKWLDRAIYQHIYGGREVALKFSTTMRIVGRFL